ncbi:MAG: NAD-dependent epimerase/dehydratase family protein [Bacillota bacterium]
MKVLFIGGTGRISTAVSHEAVNRGMELYVLNRGNHNEVLPENAHPLIADINDDKAVEDALEGHTFDAIVDWVAFTPEHVKRDHRLFKGKTRQYVFISSASAYQKPLPASPITEDIPLDNPYWEYSQNKARCEAYLDSVKGKDFHVTTIRPSHTYDDTTLVFQLKSGAYPFTLIKRILEREPIVVPDDGKSLWTLTYNWDFAGAFLDTLGNEKAYDDVFHLTSDKVYSWNEITESFYEALDIEPNILHIPLDFILKHFPEAEGELKGDKMEDAVFDNAKIRAIAPNYRSETEYPDIAKKAVAHYMSTPELQTVDDAFLKRYDAMIEAYEALEK